MDWHFLLDILRNSVFITGIVTVMMMLIESVNLESHGHFFAALKKTQAGQVAVAALLGLIPGCIGGFAAVSLYKQRLLGFGALVAMMIASTGDEAFMLLAMMPGKALWLFLGLFGIAIVCGLLIDLAGKRCKLFRRPEERAAAAARPDEGASGTVGPQAGRCAAGTTAREESSRAAGNTVLGEGGGDAHSCCHHSHGPEAGGALGSTYQEVGGALGSSYLGEVSAPDSTHIKEGGEGRHWGLKRIIMLVGVVTFIAALSLGVLDHEHSPEHGLEHGLEHDLEHDHGHVAGFGDVAGPGEVVGSGDVISFGDVADSGDVAGPEDRAGSVLELNFLDETWMNVLFGALSIILVVVLVKASDRFVNHSLWEHIVKRHLPVIFAWTFGILAIVGIVMQFVDISSWIGRNTVAMIFLAAAIGLIPESGPHMIFVTLYAGGLIPLPVLLASCISQDGHSSLPLLSGDKRSFITAKLINFCIAILFSFSALLI